MKDSASPAEQLKFFPQKGLAHLCGNSAAKREEVEYSGVQKRGYTRTYSQQLLKVL